MRGFINILGPVWTRAFKPGASEVKSIVFTSATDSSTRATVLTPTSGKKIRIVSCRQTSASATATGFGVWFGTGAAVTTDTTKVIDYAVLDLTDLPVSTIEWPDGGGPVGAVDEVVSFATNGDITTGARIVIHYREE